MTSFIFPTHVTRLTSGFRTSSRPNHHGIDLASSGYHEIFAVAAGTVTRSEYLGAYGECTMITHQINGVIWESVYAHLRRNSRRVQKGQRVSQGQVIGVMGATGNATGQHLHFELHRGTWNNSKSNAVNPLIYLNENINQNPPPQGQLFSTRHISRGDQVRKYQNQLLAVGEHLPQFGADGIFGAETDRAVKSFQQRHRIQVDGIIGPQTHQKLQEVLPNYTRLLRRNSPFMNGEDVRAVQRVVGTRPDSYYGPETVSQVVEYQHRYRLTVDGIVGPQTWGHMF